MSATAGTRGALRAWGSEDERARRERRAREKDSVVVVVVVVVAVVVVVVCSDGVGGVVACGVSQVRKSQTDVMQRGK
jgi:t-SNARE complex subunit (syntaxin)